MKRERKLMAVGAVVLSAALTGCVPFVDGGVEDYYYSPDDNFNSPYYGSPWYQPAPSVFYPGNNPWYSPGYYPPSFNRPGIGYLPPSGINRPQAPSNNRPVQPSPSGQRPGAVQTAPSGGGQSGGTQQGSGNSGGNRGGATSRH